jgi:hypothetical protein
MKNQNLKNFGIVLAASILLAAFTGSLVFYIQTLKYKEEIKSLHSQIEALQSN